MIQKILEYDFKGFHLVLDEENGGWNCVIGTQEIKFPNAQAAEVALSAILVDSKKIIEYHGGVVVRKVPVSTVTKIVETESLNRKGDVE